MLESVHFNDVSRRFVVYGFDASFYGYDYDFFEMSVGCKRHFKNSICLGSLHFKGLKCCLRFSFNFLFSFSFNFFLLIISILFSRFTLI